MNVLDEFVYAEVRRNLSKVQLLLAVELLLPLMVCTDIHLNICLPVSSFPETVHNSEEFCVMDWPVALPSGDSFCIIHNLMKLVAFVDDVVLRQNVRKSLLASISFHNGPEGSVELGKDGS